MFQLSITTEDRSNPWGNEKKFFLNLSNGTPLGSCHIAERKELMNFHIYGDWKRKGLGKFFIREIMKDYSFYLYCHENIIPFYVSCGLIKTGTRRFYYEGELTVFSNEL